MPQPPAQPAPLVLDYQRLEKRRKRAVGGLILMAGALLVFSGLGFIPLVEMFARGRLRLEALAVLIPFLWGALYFTMAVLFKYRKKWAGWVALAMTAAKLAGWLALCGFALFELLASDYSEPWWVFCLVAGLLLTIAMGPAAVIFEVWWALREPANWVEPPT